MNRLVYDLHQDLASHIRERALFDGAWQTSYDLVREQRLGLVVATAFPVPPNDNFFDPITDDLIERDFADYAARSEFQIVRDASDLPTETGQPTRLLLHVEGLNVFDDSPASWQKLERWYDQGWRSLGLVWNLTNPLGGGANDADGGLTELGRNVLTWLDERRMVIDLAHMNQPTFDDVLTVTTGPVLVSHANARGLCDHRRNLTDSQIRAVAERGGIVGVTAVPQFLVANGEADIDDVVAHTRYIADLIGVEHLAIGSDFGGILVQGVVRFDSVTAFDALFEALRTAGFSDPELEDIAWRNAHRVLASQLA